MPRPRLHTELTASALLDAAERLLREQGLDALTVRRVAEAVGATTRSVYSTYGSKEALLAALGSRAFDMLADTVRSLPVTDDPVHDLIAAATDGFRRFACAHPALFQVGIQQTWLPPEASARILPAASLALGSLNERLARAADAGAVAGRSVEDAAAEFHALCEGLAAIELRGFLPAERAEHTWADAVSALITGWQASPRPAASRTRRARGVAGR